MSTVPLAVPVQPDGDEARRLLLDELSKQPYRAARPTPLDLAAQAFFDWFQSLFTDGDSAAPPVLLVAALVGLVVIVVVALIAYGVPRLNRRSRGAGILFGEEDRRTADELRRSAEAALKRGEFALAVLERFRAVARGLDERTLVQLFPGTTATGFALRAAAVFDGERDGLRAAAALFDGVRYADRGAAREDAESIAALDARIAAARPRLAEPVGA